MHEVSKEIEVLQSSSFPEATIIFKSDHYRLAFILLFWHLAHIFKKKLYTCNIQNDIFDIIFTTITKLFFYITAPSNDVFVSILIYEVEILKKIYFTF